MANSVERCEVCTPGVPISEGQRWAILEGTPEELPEFLARLERRELHRRVAATPSGFRTGDLVCRDREYGIVTGDYTCLFGNGLNQVMTEDDWLECTEVPGASIVELVDAFNVRFEVRRNTDLR
jgi:hypothetical protein